MPGIIRSRARFRCRLQKPHVRLVAKKQELEAAVPTRSFGDDLHRIVRQCDARVERQRRKIVALRKALPTADLGTEEEVLRVMIDTQREAHQALERHLSS